MTEIPEHLLKRAKAAREKTEDTGAPAAGEGASRIPEELEFTPGLLDFLQQSSILPGRHGEISQTNLDGTMSVVIDGHTIGVSAFASSRILVTA